MRVIRRHRAVGGLVGLVPGADLLIWGASNGDRFELAGDGGLFVGYYAAYVTWRVLAAQQSPASAAFAMMMTGFVVRLTVIVIVVAMLRTASPP